MNRKKIRTKLSKPALILIIGIIIIAIPCLLFGGILLSAALQTGNPIYGDRYKGDLDPAITKDDISKLEKEISSISNVEKVSVVLKSGTLRINVDLIDSIDTDKSKDITEEVYKTVEKNLNISTYFTSTSSKKMYDLAINVYNTITNENESQIYYILTKNAMMENYSIQLVSEPLDADLAADLRGENIVDEEDKETNE